MAHRLSDLLEKEKIAVETAEENCKKLKLLNLYGVPSVEDRVPSNTASVLAMPTCTNSSDKDEAIIRAIVEEREDYNFINKMERIIENLKQPYREIYTKAFIDGVPISKIDYENSYKIVRKGFLEVALLDADIKFTYHDLICLKTLQHKKSKRKKIIKDTVKAMLDDVITLKVNFKIEILQTSDYLSTDIDDKKIVYLFSVINELPDVERKVIVNYILDREGIDKTTSFYNTFERAILTIALIHKEVAYNIQQFEEDIKISSNMRFKKYIRNLRCKQQSLNISYK